MLKTMRKVIIAMAVAATAAIPAEAMMLGSASRVAGTDLLAKTETASLDRGFGFICRQSLAGCGDMAGGKPDFTPRLHATLAMINHLVNRQPERRVELRTRWPLAVLPREGEAVARAKRDRLMLEGLPASALRLVTLEEDEERRVVLVVATTAGEFVLDNRGNRVTRRDGAEERTASVAPAMPHFRLR